MSHVNCPYCGKGQEINHDDGYGYDEGETYKQECVACEKNFAFLTIIHLSHEAWAADCLNGAEHKYAPVCSEFSRDWVRCSDCGHEKGISVF